LDSEDVHGQKRTWGGPRQRWPRRGSEKRLVGPKKGTMTVPAMTGGKWAEDQTRKGGVRIQTSRRSYKGRKEVPGCGVGGVRKMYKKSKKEKIQRYGGERQ